jgi:heat shock protein HslJ
MNHFAKPATLLFLAMIALIACKSGPDATSGASKSRSSGTAAGSSNRQSPGSTVGNTGEFTDVVGLDWQLVEIRLASRRVQINRDKLAAEGFGEIFTLRFEDGRVSGIGAPNRYFGPYTLAGNQAISMGQMASTQMATFREPEELKEHEYYAYLQNASKWGLSGGNLELHSKGADGAEAVLVFVLVR